MRNPPWSRDELLITLNFYLKYSPSIPDKKSPEISDLSEILNRLQLKIGGERQDKFRNTNGVYMKLMNFRRFDPTYEGKGLDRGNKDEEVVWNLYSSKPDKLKIIVKNIYSFITSDTIIPLTRETFFDEEESEEGRILTKTHRYRERDPKLIKRKKEQVLKQEGVLVCEVCRFDFFTVYGNRGEGYIECHHTKPVSQLTPGEKTKISDLSLVCSNCHRMVHRKQPWLSISELKNLLQ